MFSGELAGALATGGAVFRGIRSGAAGALANGAAGAGDSDGTAAGAGALATGADSDGAGALASAGGALSGAVTGGADAVGGSALGAGEVAPPRTPPVTLIESPVMSSVEDGCAAGAGASVGAPLSGRIEFPTVPSPIAGTADDDDNGMLAPSLS